MAALNPVYTVGSQIAEALEVHGLARGRSARARAIELLDAVRVPDPQRRVDEYPHQLSGGLRQRALIAAALACQPRVLIADEPTTALDVTIQGQILDLLRDLQARFRLALLLITHDLGVVAQQADRVAVMYAGRIVEEGPSAEVFGKPAHPYTAALAAAFPVIGDEAFRLKPSGLGGDPPDPRALPNGCPFHPRCAVVQPECTTRDVELWPAGDGRRAACVHVPGAR
jgi:peptide/nickel transport system ATP-binding protein